MKKDEVYRIALLCFNTDLDKLGDNPEETNEYKLCETFYAAAEAFCIDAYDWSFMYRQKKFEDSDLIAEKSIIYDDIPEYVYEDDLPSGRRGFLKVRSSLYAYKAPSDMAKPMFVNGKFNATIERIGNILRFKEKNPELIYIASSVDYNKDEEYPTKFFYMIAYKLATEIQPNIAPENQVMLTAATQKMQTVFQAMRQSEMEMTRKETPPAHSFVF